MESIKINKEKISELKKKSSCVLKCFIYSTIQKTYNVIESSKYCFCEEKFLLKSNIVFREHAPIFHVYFDIVAGKSLFRTIHSQPIKGKGNLIKPV